MGCRVCNRELTSGDGNGLCSICKLNEFNSIPYLITHKQTLSAWQCPFCKMVYSELMFACNCQAKKESEAKK